MKNESGFKPSTSKDSWLLLNAFLSMIWFSKHRPSFPETPGFKLNSRQLKSYWWDPLCTERQGRAEEEARPFLILPLCFFQTSHWGTGVQLGCRAWLGGLRTGVEALSSAGADRFVELPEAGPQCSCKLTHLPVLPASRAEIGRGTGTTQKTSLEWMNEFLMHGGSVGGQWGNNLCFSSPFFLYFLFSSFLSFWAIQIRALLSILWAFSSLLLRRILTAQIETDGVNTSCIGAWSGKHWH